MPLEVRFKMDRAGDTAPLRVSILSEGPFGAQGAAGLGRASENPEGQIDADGWLRALDGTPYMLSTARFNLDPEPPVHRLMVRRDSRIIINVTFVPKTDGTFVDINQQLTAQTGIAVSPGTMLSLRELMAALQAAIARADFLLNSIIVNGTTSGQITAEQLQEILAQLVNAEQVQDIVAGMLVPGNDGILFDYHDGDGQLMVYNTRPINPEWLNIANKPDVFPPAPHVHPMSQILGLVSALAVKADLTNQGKLMGSQLPTEALSLAFSADSQAGMLALPASPGHTCERTDQGNAVYLLVGNQGSASSWIQIRSSAGSPVTSVNGQTGDVTITAAGISAAPASHVARTDNPHSVNKAQIGLANVTNDAQIPLAQKGQPNGVAPLDNNGLIPSMYLPIASGGGADQIAAVSTPPANLAVGQTAEFTVNLPGNSFYGRNVAVTGLVQAQGHQLEVRFFEAGSTGAWTGERYYAIFGPKTTRAGTVFNTEDTAEGPFYVDQASGKQLRVRIKNVGSTAINAAVVTVTFTYR